ncbi:MAG: KpsF/GutQ family sugar-phosphate isomerase [Proteobacteria bacterium]|nr:KpsF/GutQ family sugar-phosphate isomerase [Pseudomonadota bacterium]
MRLKTAKRVLEQESQALKELASFLSDSFNQALDIIRQISGRVIVTGMGKSGHVARKMAATLASTGQPSFFVHPAEASHGDLGMITKEDAIIALSNQGESRELGSLIDYAKRFSIPLIGITSRPQSTLAKVSNCTILIPNVTEACPMGLAPTTSTTMLMALGDALAITLLTEKGFSNKDFKLFHPGGRLGQQLLHVTDRMHQGDTLPFVQENDTSAQILQEISHKKFGCTGVLNAQHQLVGIITDGDLRRHLSPQFFSLKAHEIMTKEPITISPECLMAEALALLQNKKITSIFVVDQQKIPLGLIHIHDFLSIGVF